MSKDYYKILGVEKSATDDEVKKAFRKLAHKFHPDKKTGDEAKFKEVNEAYQVLGKPEKRQKYDQFGSNFDQQGGFGGGAGWEDFMNASRGQSGGGFQFDFGDIVGDLFGFGGNRNRKGKRGKDIQVDIEISFEDAVFGIEREINLTKNNNCDVCAGSGAEPGSNIKTCRECNGQGQVSRVQQTILGAIQTNAVCSSCNGVGDKAEKECKHCNGRGFEKSASSYKFKIPAGISNGETIRISGKGENLGKNATSGDLYVVVHVKSHKEFKRSGADIYSNLTVNYPQAVLGETVEVNTVDGKKKVVVPSGTQSGQQIRLRGLGAHRLNRSGRGDHFLKVIVNIPKRVSRKAKKLLKELESEL
ncbi:MAG: molecular chaperone DnaJ [Candidatus Magasanikbacteria bacterium]|nr:molecular chaperone DnaJ [Candidatus Magasanikbacteria bacterium]